MSSDESMDPLSPLRPIFDYPESKLHPKSAKRRRSKINSEMILGPPRKTILPLVQKAPIQNLGAKVSVDARKWPRKSTELRNRLKRLPDIKLASRTARLNGLTFPANFWSILRPILLEANFCSLKLLNLSFLSSGSRSA